MIRVCLLMLGAVLLAACLPGARQAAGRVVSVAEWPDGTARIVTTTGAYDIFGPLDRVYAGAVVVLVDGSRGRWVCVGRTCYASVPTAVAAGAL